MGRVIDALIAYRLLKLLVTPFKKTKAYKLGIIDEKGKVLIKSKELPKKFPLKFSSHFVLAQAAKMRERF